MPPSSLRTTVKRLSIPGRVQSEITIGVSIWKIQQSFITCALMINVMIDCMWHTLALWQQMTDAETISFTFCFSLITVFKFRAVTTTGGISETVFDEVETWISFAKSIVTSNLHQLTCSNQIMSTAGSDYATFIRVKRLTRWEVVQLENFEIDSHDGPFTFLLIRNISSPLQTTSTIRTLSSVREAEMTIYI